MSQPTQRHTNRLLGYPDDARLLIINADDFGMCHAANAAITRSLTAGVVTSTTLMVPCAWALHGMQWLAAHPDIPFGVHLTAVGDSPHYRWKPISCQEH
ncbi:MAG: ChbG/HpnK family deacetylase, partial [Chloroflexi bacterium]|nr:ChbG/HpnK family deacetylase [Chloroflexota bacterium]